MHLSNALSSAALGYSASLPSSSLPPLLFSCMCASLCNILFLCLQPEPICSKYQPKSIVYRNKPVHWYSPSKVRDKPPKGAPPPSDTHSKASENWINLFFSLPHPPIFLSWLAFKSLCTPPPPPPPPFSNLPREAGDVRCISPAWNLRAGILIPPSYLLSCCSIQSCCSSCLVLSFFANSPFS